MLKTEEQRERSLIASEVLRELERATEKHPTPIRSRHEGYGVLAEEFEEMWDEIKADAPDERVRAEALQVAAMAIRMIYDLNLKKGD